VLWVLAVIAVTTFLTATHRTIGISMELRRKAMDSKGWINPKD
jgi:hypothetical protein